jgi:hypothetical protein
MRSGNRYVQAVARPGSLRLSAAGILGRLPISTFGLGTVLLVSSFTGRYGLAGAVAGAGSAGYALASGTQDPDGATCRGDEPLEHQRGGLSRAVRAEQGPSEGGLNTTEIGGRAR